MVGDGQKYLMLVICHFRHFFGGDGWYWQPMIFSLIDGCSIVAIQSVSNDGKQEYVGLCNHDSSLLRSGGNYAYAFGFEFCDGTTIGGGNPMSAYSYVAVTQDGCAVNGGENGSLSQATVFSFDTPSVPIVNVDAETAVTEESTSGSINSKLAWLR